jgi:hypothetical protein
MKKGVTVAQVARVADGFTKAGIMVHAYLMYGFPTQTAQETIDSLEVVRQLFKNEVLQSGFWHRFAMTSHSPVGLDPAAYDVIRIGPEFGGFADNDLFHEDPKGANHDLFAEGLRKSLFNYMHEVGIDMPLSDWFDFKTPRTTMQPYVIENAILDNPEKAIRMTNSMVWLGAMPTLEVPTKKKKGYAAAFLTFFNKKEDFTLETGVETAEWLYSIFPKLLIQAHQEPLSVQDFKSSFEKANIDDYTDFQEFTESYTFSQLREKGLLIL